MAELLREKNVATKVVFPLIDSANRPQYFSGTVWGSLTNASVTAYSWADDEAAATLSISGTPSELGSTGLWELSLTQSEMNPDSGNDDYISIKLNADEIDEQTLLIYLKSVGGGDSAATIWAYGTRALTDKSGFAIDTNNDKVGYDLNVDQSGVTVGQVDQLGTQAKADVNAEMIDVLSVDTQSELSQGAPPDSPTLVQAIIYRYMKDKNKAIHNRDNSVREVYNAAGVRITKQTTSDENNILTVNKAESGA